MMQALLSAVVGLALTMVLVVGLLSAALVLLGVAAAVVGGLGRVLVPARRARLSG